MNFVIILRRKWKIFLAVFIAYVGVNIVFSISDRELQMKILFEKSTFLPVKNVPVTFLNLKKYRYL